jgi:hypothetical protein
LISAGEKCLGGRDICSGVSKIVQLY